MKYARRCIALLAALLVIAGGAAAAGTAFAFRGGITWDTTQAGMMTAEGLAEGSGNYNVQSYSGYTFVYLWNRGAQPEDVYYVFLSGQGGPLVMAYQLMADDAYAGRQAQMSVLYGAPADISADAFSDLLDRMSPNSYVFGLTAWRLDDGTIAALFTIDGASYEGYLNEQRILNGA